MEMEDLKKKAETLTDHVGDYIELYSKLVVVNATEKATGAVSVALVSVLTALLTIFVLFFGSLGVGWWIGEQLNNMLAGFGIVAGFYALIALIIVALRISIAAGIQNMLIKNVYEQKNNDSSEPDRSETGIAEAA